MATSQNSRPQKFQPVIGQQYGNRVVRHPATMPHYWICECLDCGVIGPAPLRSLREGKCCICVRSEATARDKKQHGHGAAGSKRTPTYRAWAHMLGRCRNPNDHDYRHYGGRGIKPCQGLIAFRDFLSVMGEAPAGYTLDRQDNSKGYTCGECQECQANNWTKNCRWATRQTQSKNRRSAHLLTHNGRTQSIAEWAEETGIDARVIEGRINRDGWSVSRALTDSVVGFEPKADVVVANGQSHSVAEWAAITGLSETCIRLRLAKGMSPNEALSLPSISRLLTWNGRSHTLTEWGEITGLGVDVLNYRINKRRWPLEKALTTPRRGSGEPLTHE